MSDILETILDEILFVDDSSCSVVLDEGQSHYNVLQGFLDLYKMLFSIRRM